MENSSLPTVELNSSNDGGDTGPRQENLQVTQYSHWLPDSLGTPKKIGELNY